MPALSRLLAVCASVVLVSLLIRPLPAQEIRVTTQGGTMVVEQSQPAPVVVKSEGEPAKPAAGPDKNQPGPGGKPEKPEPGGPDKGKPGESGEKKDKPEAGKDGKEGDQTVKPTQRTSTPPSPPDPNELKVRPDANGKISFNFKGQPWPEVLEWLAEVSGKSLDWQELPGDYLNLSTQRSYTVKEARDLINRHLLARGYTLLEQDDVLSVVSIKTLNPGMVPRVEPAELDRRSPYEFVKVSFPLDWLMADVAEEEFKPMLSPNGKLTALEATNRLEAMDAVINLRELRAVLTAEQSGNSQDRLVREFKLIHTRASDVREQLQQLLGVETKSGPQQPMTPEQMQQQAAMMQQMQQMQQQQQQQQGEGKRGGRPGMPKPKPQVMLVVNQRKNSILANAPADKMAIIEAAVKAIDVPTDRDQSLAATTNRMQIYRLAALDPEPLIKTLQDLGNLDPGTRLEVDRRNRALIAYASLADHVTIRALIQKLDGSDRKFEVIPLRRLEADYVAGTIEFMMVGKKEKDTRRRNPWEYDPWSYRGRGQGEEETNQFRVDADVEHNRLLLWANDIELAEVQHLLEKLGEIPSKESKGSTVRVLDIIDGEETNKLLEEISRAWPSVAPNPLVLPPERPRPSSPAPRESSPPAASPSKTTSAPPPQPVLRFAQLQREEPGKPETGAEDSSPKQSDSPPPTKPEEPKAQAETLPPISITRAPDGRLMISSQDTRALDALEDLLTEFAPPRKEYEIFKLKYALAYSVALTLKDFFSEEEQKQSRGWDPFYYDYGYRYGRDDTQEKGRASLSKRRPLRFISDSDTNSILVQGADPKQLAKIEELIEFYDQPQPTDAQSVRKTEVVQIRYSKAKIIADAVKDVYRDLLSANDKALADAKKAERSFSYVFGEGETAEQKPKFKGSLSIGVDDVSNTLIVSAPAYLFANVRKMIEELDEAAKPVGAVRVVKLGAGISPTRVQQALSGVLGEGPAAKRPPEGPKPPGPGGPQPPGRQGPNGEGGNP